MHCGKNSAFVVKHVVHILSLRFKSFNVLINYLRNNVYGTPIIQHCFISYMIFVIR